MHIETLYKLLNGNQAILEGSYFVESVNLIDESMIARRPDGWFNKTNKPHVDISVDRWGSVQIERCAVNQDGSIMIWDADNNSWNIQVFAPMDVHTVKKLIEEIEEDE